ncbi:hypothetical protein LSH36_1368g00003 [Paralvinella palmiformis]|uniref:Aldehyde oxidase/xanthine dehydrogenase second molybdopterin binding domain-containing protein n=1 Tax=Paralvinella palmiformis TaxID=53620 RepID=A0AAD9MQH4_9ANNE|nr:hypothetical protein LSH36_1368g00003 [Paralvinella palmiformis]
MEELKGPEMPNFGYDWETGEGRGLNYYTSGAACSEVEVDIITGQHVVRRVDIVMDVGKSLNPAIDIGQIEGAFLQPVHIVRSYNVMADWTSLTDRQLVNKQVNNGKALENKMDTFKIKMDMALESMAKLETHFTDLENGVEYIEREYEEQKLELAEIKSTMATSENVLELKQKIVERGNYSRRNNILIQNIPEGVEDADCKGNPKIEITSELYLPSIREIKFISGYGLYTMEELEFDQNGRLTTRNAMGYKIPRVTNVPRQFNVTLLKDSGNPYAVYSSKGIGEPPLVLAHTVALAIRETVKAYRKDINQNDYFQLNYPVTPDKIRALCPK